MHSNGWNQRNKQEGPRKISDLHAEVARKKLEQDRRDAMERMSSGGRYDRGDGFRRGGSTGPPSMQSGRSSKETTMDMPMKNLAKVPSSENITLGPQTRPGFGFGRGAGNRAPSPATGGGGAPLSRQASRPNSQGSVRGGDTTPVAAATAAPSTPAPIELPVTYEVDAKLTNQVVNLLEQVKGLLAGTSDRLSAEEQARIQQANRDEVLVELGLCATEYGAAPVARAFFEAAKKARGFSAEELQQAVQCLIVMAAEVPEKGGEPLVGSGELARAVPWALHQVHGWVEDKPVMARLVCDIGGLWCWWIW